MRKFIFYIFSSTVFAFHNQFSKGVLLDKNRQEKTTVIKLTNGELIPSEFNEPECVDVSYSDQLYFRSRSGVENFILTIGENTYSHYGLGGISAYYIEPDCSLVSLKSVYS